jgi:hypothetical protein
VFGDTVFFHLIPQYISVFNKHIFRAFYKMPVFRALEGSQGKYPVEQDKDGRRGDRRQESRISGQRPAQDRSENDPLNDVEARIFPENPFAAVSDKQDSVEEYQGCPDAHLPPDYGVRIGTDKEI